METQAGLRGALSGGAEEDGSCLQDDGDLHTASSEPTSARRARWELGPPTAG